MRILFLIDSLGAGGAEQSTAALLPRLAERGHDVSVAILYEGAQGTEAARRAAGHRVRVLQHRHWWGRVRELRALIRAERPDVVHTALFAADQIGRLAAWRTGARVVASLVSTPYAPERFADPKVTRWKLRLVQVLDGVTARLFVDRFHAVSQGAADANARALRLPASRIRVVQRGRDRATLGEWSQARRAEVRSRLGLDDGTRVVLAVGRHEHAKAHPDLVAATELLLDAVPSARVLLAGRDGNATGALKASLAAHPRAAAAVQLLGHRTDVADLLCAADVLAISSHYEGTAGAALEAMALRCPVVCTAVAGVRGVLRDGENAVLTPVADPPALAAALARVFTDPDLADRLRDEGLADFERHYRIEVAAEAMEQLYVEVVRGGHRQ